MTSTRTFVNNKSERFRDEYDSVYLHRSCLRDGCYTTNVKVNNDTCYCVSSSCNQGEAVSDYIGLSHYPAGLNLEFKMSVLSDLGGRWDVFFLPEIIA